MPFPHKLLRIPAWIAALPALAVMVFGSGLAAPADTIAAAAVQAPAAAPPGGAATPVQPAAPPALAAPRPSDELEREVARMNRVAGCWSPSFSPDGLRLAFVSNLTGVPQVWTVAADGGWPEEVTSFDDQVGGVEWSPDGRWLAFSLAPGGGMNAQVYLMHPDGKQLVRATDGGSETNSLSGFSHDGRQLLLSSNRADRASRDAFTYDIATATWHRAASGGGFGALTDVSRDGRYGLVSRVRQRGDEDVYAVDLQTGREALLTPHSPPGLFGDARFSADGTMVYFASNQGRDRTAFGRLRLVRGQAGEPPSPAPLMSPIPAPVPAVPGAPSPSGPTTSPGAAGATGGAGASGAAGAGAIEFVAARADAELEDFSLTEDGHTAALLWNVAGRSQLAFLDLDTLAVQPAPALPAETVSGMAFSRNGRLLAMTLSGSRQPMDVWALDRASGRLRQVTHSPHAGVDLAALVAPELVTFQALDGLELSGWLYRPPGRPATGGAAVLSFHGGPEAQERPIFNPLYQALLARGIAVFAPNVRGSSGFGKRFVNLDNGALRTGAINDIRAAALYLVRAGIADPKRLGIMGGSYGGYMTMAGLTEFPELFAAGADLYGIVNFESFFAHTEPWMAAISKVEYGDPATQLDMLRALSPIHKLNRVVAPTLVLHGANDTNVPVIEAEQVVAALKGRGVPVEYLLFPDEGHGFRKTANRIKAATAIVRWFDAYLVRQPGATGAGAAP
jgi:dipeptidyl aminopeptidase/acylaminoacyl peptidase